MSMHWSEEELDAIYDRTDGYCPYCGKKLARSNHGDMDSKGGWQVDNVIPLARGGPL